MREYEIIIIGGGASGLFAAIAAAKHGCSSVAVIERNNRVGKKILSTGNGKCNLTNIKCSKHQTQCMKEFYFSENDNFISDVVTRFDVEDTVDFFYDIGLSIKNKDGYLYPMSEQATSVLDILRYECESLKIDIITDTFVETIDYKNESFIINKNLFKSKEVIISTGGKAAPKTGSDGNGYKLAEIFGHSIIEPGPALMGLKCKENFFKSISGVRIDATVTLNVDNMYLLAESGNLQLTDYGISGIPVFQLSRHVYRELKKKDEVIIIIDFFTEYNIEEIEHTLRDCLYNNPHRSIEQHMAGIINKKLAVMIIKQCGYKSSEILSEDKIHKIAYKLKNLYVTVIDTNDYNNAQSTCGGVNTIEINSLTMESKRQKNLFFTGEVLDVDGICGGFNLQFAWATGYIAGVSAAKKIKDGAKIK